MRLLLAVVLCSCSLTMSAPPDTLPRHGSIDCSEGKARPWFDVFWAVEGYSLGLFALPISVGGGATAGAVALAVGGGLGALFTVAASRGFDVANACRAARNRVALDGNREAAELTNRAVIAAREGDCSTARQLADAIREASPGVYSTAFAADPAIAACKQGRVPTGEFCFEEGDGKTASLTVCMATRLACDYAAARAPEGRVLARCAAAKPALLAPE